jgi:hypothetical protein
VDRAQLSADDLARLAEVEPAFVERAMQAGALKNHRVKITVVRPRLTPRRCMLLLRCRSLVKQFRAHYSSLSLAIENSATRRSTPPSISP